MTDTTPDPELDDETPAPTDNLAELREAANRGKAATAEAEAARRELAFLKAGIDTEKGPGKLLLTAYTGEPTKEAVLAAAEEYGIAPAAAQEPEPTGPEITDEERNQTRERAALATGAEPPAGEVQPDPHIAGLKAFNERRAEGVSSEDASAEYFNRVLKAAYVDHDPRAIFDEEQWKADAAGSSKAHS